MGLQLPNQPLCYPDPLQVINCLPSHIVDFDYKLGTFLWAETALNDLFCPTSAFSEFAQLLPVDLSDEP